jgi:Ohr subfamily peroxiredoxin
MRRPKTNGDNEGTNPEQLFAAAWGACFLGALGGVTRETGVDISNAKLDVAIGIGEDTVNGGSGLMATISLAIPGMDLAEVQCLADQAHTTCPYSKATRGNIPVQVVAVESTD